MTVKALDLQVILPKIQEVGKIQQVQQNSEQAQQQIFAAQLLRDAEIAQRSVQNLPQPKEGRIREREKEKEWSDSSSQKESRRETLQDREQNLDRGHGKANFPLGQFIDLKI